MPVFIKPSGQGYENTSPPESPSSSRKGVKLLKIVDSEASCEAYWLICLAI